MSADNPRIIDVNISEEMKSAYIDYSMSVIVSRALPDVRDGLKPVHRRVLFGMHELGLVHNKAHKKSARIVGEVLGKYHPHGDTSVYDSMVRMAQDWSLRYPLVDGQGNFGSMDGDSPAAMRYTEARLRKISSEMLADIDKDTVDFQLNFDDTLKEPTVLPTRIPNLLVNGASGIAVGMATNMLPHNLNESIDAIIATIDNPDIELDELMTHIKAPDFPTGGIIRGISGIKQAYETGRGRVVVRAKTEIVESKTGKETIVITEIPYQVNKAQLVVKIADLVTSGKVAGISDIRDESDRNGLRVVVEIKRDAMGSVVLSKLFQYTPLQTSYGINNIALVNGRPVVLPLKQIIEEFIKFRIEVIVRRTQYELAKAEARAHILEGYLIALDHLDEIIALIRASRTPDDAKEGLMSQFGLSEIQAKAILEMRLQRLTGMERDKVKEEYAEIKKKIERYKAILADEGLQRDIIKQELTEIKETYGDERRTEISFEEGEIAIEDLIPNDEVVITISNLGYIKRTKLDEYRTQARGGRGSKGSKTRETDFLEHIFVANNHNYLLLFTEKGICHWVRVFEIPEAAKTSTGKVIRNIINLPKEDKVKAYMKIDDLTDEDFMNSHNVLFATKKGKVKKTAMEQFSRPRSNGIIAITINEDDELVDARLTNGSSHVFLGTSYGKAIHFLEEKVRPMGRTAAGVRGITLGGADDEVVGLVCVDSDAKNTSILVISEKGTGKRTDVDAYSITNRGGKGVKSLAITEKTGRLIAIKAVTDDNEMIITCESGITIRMHLDNIRLMGRATQGVRVIKLSESDKIADVAITSREESTDKELEGIEAAFDESSDSKDSTPDTDRKTTESTDTEGTEEPPSED